MGYTTHLAHAFLDMRTECDRINAKYGALRYPDGTGSGEDIELAARFKAACKANGPAEDNWRDILREEVYEAFAETDPERLQQELTQIGALAAQWKAEIYRRTGAPAQRLAGDGS